MNFLNLLASLFLLGTASAKADVAAWKTRTVYQILTDRFWRSNGDTKTPCDLKKYCGGDFTGIQQKLSYIKDMGFDAIWISPVVDNMADGYHGYWFQDWEKINSNFGTVESLKQLIDACHKMDMLVMVDVVANHVAPVDMDFSSINPFNKPEHYHTKCDITDWDNQYQMEYCRLLDLPDLNQTNAFVRPYLVDWIRRHTTDYDFDGIRIDTVPHVEKPFWTEYTQAGGVFSIGEVFKNNETYIADYQNYMDSTLNYPMWYTIRDVWGNGQSMKQIPERWARIKKNFKDPTVLGLFLDNHDNARFLNSSVDMKLFKASLAFTLTGQGIPMMYYGTEQAYAGGPDPNNREPLWTNFDNKSEMYLFVKTINSARKAQKSNLGLFEEKWVDDNMYVYTKGRLLVALTNKLHGTFSLGVPVGNTFDEGEILCNIFNPTQCAKIVKGNLFVSLHNGDIQIFIPKSSTFFASNELTSLETSRD